MSLIHPIQIDEVNEAFTPTVEEIDYCRRVVQAFDDARVRGEGSIAFGGQLLDVPNCGPSPANSCAGRIVGDLKRDPWAETYLV